MILSLIILSFLIHLIVLIAIYLLYKQVQQKNENSAEIAKLFDIYLQEVKAENERLQMEILRSSSQTNNQKHSHNYVKPSTANQALVKTEGSETETDSYKPPISEESANVDLSLHAKILQLHDKGFSIEDIARKLDCGKTEVELFMKLYNKKST